jgi:hypothetical protein
LRLPLLLAVAGALALPAVASADDTAANAIAALNAQRAANGIPAGITERAEWSNDCALHNEYQRENGGVLTHQEDPAKPGYTDGGAFAGQNSVLSSSGYGADGANPWEMAPIHLMQLLAPALGETGYDHGCMITIAGWTRPQPPVPQIFTYPGNGTHTIYPSEVANEGPFVPGDFVGLPAGTTTGPHIFVLGFGTGKAHLTDASLTGPSGPVEIRTVDDFTDTVGVYLPDGGIIIPVQPLVSGATYTAHATLGGVPYDWSFSAGKLLPQLSGQFDTKTLAASATSSSGAPISAVVKRLPSGTVVASKTLASGEVWKPALGGGRFVVEYGQPETADYQAGLSKSAEFTLRQPPKLAIRSPKRKKNKVTVKVTADRELSGSRADLATRKLKKSCNSRGKKCRYKPAGKTTHKRLTLKSSLSVALKLKKGDHLQVTVSIPDTTAGEILFSAGKAARTL